MHPALLHAFRLPHLAALQRTHANICKELDAVEKAIKNGRDYLAKPGARRELGRIALAVARRKRRDLNNALVRLEAEVRAA